MSVRLLHLLPPELAHRAAIRVLPWLPAVYVTLMHVVFIGSMRYREPAMMAFAVLAAGVLAGSTAKSVFADERGDRKHSRGSSIKE